MAAVFACLPATVQSQSAEEMASRVDQHYNQLHSLRAQFTESYEGLGMRRVEHGTLLLLKPGRMRWDYAQPAGKLFLLDGRFAWFYTRGDAQVQRLQARQINDLRSPLRFLLGHTNLEKELTGVRLTATPEGNSTLTGKPRGLEDRVSRISVTVAADGTIVGLEIEEIDGALTRFLFTAQEPNATVPPAAFRFLPPPGVPVVDALPPV